MGGAWRPCGAWACCKAGNLFGILGGCVQIGLDWTGLDWIGLNWIGGSFRMSVQKIDLDLESCGFGLGEVSCLVTRNKQIGTAI
jgi:hypothetical protein